MLSQKVNRILYIICIATAVFCRSPSSESTKNLTEKMERKKAGIRMMILIVFIILCALVFICKKFDQKSSQEQEFEVIRSEPSEILPGPAVIVVDTHHDHGNDKTRPMECKAGPNNHSQTVVDLSSAWEETSASITETIPAAPIMLELDTTSLQPRHVEKQQQPQQPPPQQQQRTQVTETLGRTNRSAEARNTRITKTQLFGKARDVMRIAWTTKEMSKVAVQVI